MKKIADTKAPQVPEVPRDAKEEYRDQYLRALADYQNLVKRTQGEREEFIQFASEALIGKLLPVLDNLERAKGVLTDKGIDIIYNELWQVLQGEGVERIKIDKIDVFDPMTMECISVEEGGKLLQEVRAGYILKGKVIRAVRVKVVI